MVSLNQIVRAINSICPQGQDAFIPSKLRMQLSRPLPTVEPALIAAWMQPHLRTLRENGLIELIPTGQKRNRPYRVTDRARLEALANDPNCFLPRRVLGLEDPDGDAVPSPADESDECDERMNAIEVRLEQLENDLAQMQNKIKHAVSSLL